MENVNQHHLQKLKTLPSTFILTESQPPLFRVLPSSSLTAPHAASTRRPPYAVLRGSLLKKVLESIKDLVNDANFDCSATGFLLQPMDSSHLALVALLLRSEGFEHYRCDRNVSMGMNLNNMAKMLKCAGNDDIVTIKADDDGDTVTFMFESPNMSSTAFIEPLPVIDFVAQILDKDVYRMLTKT
ncbi:proliferating cell nuclear antigen-like [Quercus lobata]|uniref:proliferating cell nuclear antigen-like n=1 Tax=Quercus lobata TaxID=97700 RepID=UPI001244CB72|nr:proliferating cell nuclear antigen-like [Quercus lobata]